MTGIPRKRYYVILVGLIIFGAVALAVTVGWAWWHDSQISRDRDITLAKVARDADYRGCLERNELRAVILTILEGAVSRQLPRNASPEDHAYRQLLRSYVNGPELRPVDCPAILERGVK